MTRMTTITNYLRISSFSSSSFAIKVSYLVSTSSWVRGLADDEHLTVPILDDWFEQDHDIERREKRQDIIQEPKYLLNKLELKSSTF